MQKINLSVYTGKDIQNILSFLYQYKSLTPKISLDDLIEEVKKELQNVINTKDIINEPKKVERIPCPACKTGQLTKTINYDDLNILSCVTCRYSKIVEE